MAKRRGSKSRATDDSETNRSRLLIYLANAHAQHLQRLLERSYTIVTCQSAEAAERGLTSALFDALIVDRVHPDGSSTLSLVERVRRRFPSVAIIVYCSPVPSLFREIIDFSRAGIHELVLRGGDDMRETLARTLTMATREALVRYALSMLGPRLSPQVASIVQTCLAHRDGRLSVDSLARALGVTRKTLANWTSACGAPAPARLIGWSRVLIAARLLEDPGRSVEAVARATHFGAANALNGMFRRYVGHAPSVARRNGAVRSVMLTWAADFKTQ